MDVLDVEVGNNPGPVVPRVLLAAALFPGVPGLVLEPVLSPAPAPAPAPAPDPAPALLEVAMPLTTYGRDFSLRDLERVMR